MSEEVQEWVPAALVAAGAALALGDPVFAVALAVSGPLTEKIVGQTFAAVLRWRGERGWQAFRDAAALAGMTLEEFAQQVVRDVDQQEFFERALHLVARMPRENKRRALAASWAAAVTGDVADLDDELLFLRALDDLDSPHIQLLARIDRTRPGKGQLVGKTLEGSWSREELAEYEPGLADALDPLLAALLAHGLIVHPPNFSDLGDPRLSSSTARGQAFLHRLHAGPALLE